MVLTSVLKVFRHRQLFVLDRTGKQRKFASQRVVEQAHRGVVVTSCEVEGRFFESHHIAIHREDSNHPLVTFDATGQLVDRGLLTRLPRSVVRLNGLSHLFFFLCLKFYSEITPGKTLHPFF